MNTMRQMEQLNAKRHVVQVSNNITCSYKVVSRDPNCICSEAVIKLHCVHAFYSYREWAASYTCIHNSYIVIRVLHL